MTMNISVIGVGRLGISFALLLDRSGYQVIGTDIRTNYVARLNQRRIITTEPAVADMLKQSNITFITDGRQAIADSDIIYIMVATPSLADGSYNISAVERIIDDVEECEFDISGKILIIGCTTNPGDCQRIQDRLRERGIRVLYNPEFIAQGSIIQDLENADMVLIGGEDLAAIDQCRLIYDKIQLNKNPNVHTMSLTAAEIVKIGINCFLTAKISYANMVGQVLVRSGLEEDVDRALKAIGADSRVGSKCLHYGVGYGGPCLPRDNRAFAHYAQQVGLNFPLGYIIDQFNHDHTNFIAKCLVDKNIDRKPFYIKYISYKPNVDIFEESQQYRLCVQLLEEGFRVYVEPDPNIPVKLVSDLKFRFKNCIQFVSIKNLSKQDIFQLDL